MTDFPRVSIMIPAYEQEAFALEAVLSSLNQDYSALEVVFIDDASPQTRYASVLAIADDRLRCYRNADNLGRVANYRHALYDLATGEWVVMLDGDDLLTDPGFISRAIAAARGKEDVVIVAAPCIERSRHGERIFSHPGDSVVPGLEVVRQLPRQEFLFTHLSTLYRRSTAMQTDFYRSDVLSADWESLYRLALRGTVVFVDGVAGVWRIHGGNASSASSWRVLVQNLAVWPSIMAAAQAAGLSHRDASTQQRRLIAHFAAMSLPSVMRGPNRTSIFSFMASVAQLDKRAALTVLLSARSLTRIVAGLCGYYRGKPF